MYVHLITLTALLACVASNDVSVGVHNAGRKVYDQNFTASPSIVRQVRTVFVSAAEGEVISRIDITDNRPDKDGVVMITEGGVGQKNVTIELKSPTILRGLYFSVDVYTISEDEYSANETETPVATNDDTNVNNSTENTEAGAEKVANVNSTTEVPEPHKDEEVKVPAIAGKDTKTNEGSGDTLNASLPSTTPVSLKETTLYQKNL